MSKRFRWSPLYSHLFIVHYRNEGRQERTPVYENEEEAEKVATRLKGQGATHIRIGHPNQREATLHYDLKSQKESLLF